MHVRHAFAQGLGSSTEGWRVVIAEERACGLAESVWAGGGLCLSCWEWGLIAAQPWLPPLISCKWTMSGHVCACEFVDLERNASLKWKHCLKLTYETTALKRAGPWDLKGLSIVIVFILGFLTKSWVIITEGSDWFSFYHVLNLMTSIFRFVLHNERTDLVYLVTSQHNSVGMCNSFEVRMHFIAFLNFGSFTTPPFLENVWI